MIFEELIEVVDEEPHEGAMNMALDEVLLRGVEVVTLRIYRWKRRAISFGYFGKVADAEAFGGGREMVRRWTGGGVVEHGEDLTYSLLIPRGSGIGELSAGESYRVIHGALAEILGVGGREIGLAGGGGEKKSEGCFENAVRDDLMVGGEKIGGAAQRRTRWGVMHQGSVRDAGWVRSGGAELAGRLGVRVVRRGWSGAELELGGKLVMEKYGAEEWLRRI
jgi:lipoate-protein ligase A